jgi:hypothetical protein
MREKFSHAQEVDTVPPHGIMSRLPLMPITDHASARIMVIEDRSSDRLNFRLCSGGIAVMSSVPRLVDLTQIPAVPWAWVDEHVYAAIRGCSVKVLQNERRLNMGCPFRRINGTTIRYRFGDIAAFLESQPGGGGGETPASQPKLGRGRPRRVST